MTGKKSRSKLIYSELDDFIFGHAYKPVACGNGLIIGGGKVYPEINFTLPQMMIEKNAWREIENQYSDMIDSICQRAVELFVPGIVVELELLPPMTLEPDLGAEITQIMRRTLDNFHRDHGLLSVLRVTPVDVRDMVRPPRMRSGEHLEKMLRSFEVCAEAGADILSIESTGGKEIHDDALMMGDLKGILFALAVLGVKDMTFLWEHIVKISREKNVIPGGDTACGFANTAMVLADKGMIPKVLAAVDRVASVPRSLQAHVMGATGPTKDCAYEGPYIKAITGVPISMEGKSSACAHLSSIGNVAAACCDLWSNESVQNVRLLSTYAPVVSTEQLAYDCRLMNAALEEGVHAATKLRDWLVKSDKYLDPQAYILSPDIVIDICRRLVQCNSPYEMTLCAVDQTLTRLRDAHRENKLQMSDSELRWLNCLSKSFESIPQNDNEMNELIQEGPYGSKFNSEEYLLRNISLE